MYPSKTERKVVLRKKSSSEKFPRLVLYTTVVSWCFPCRINNYISHTFPPPWTNTAAMWRKGGKLSLFLEELEGHSVLCQPFTMKIPSEKRKSWNIFQKCLKFWFTSFFLINLPHKFDFLESTVPRSQVLHDLFCLQRDTFVKMIPRCVFTLHSTWLWDDLLRP